MKRLHVIVLALLLGVALVLIHSLAGRTAADRRPSKHKAPDATSARARMSEQVALHAAGRGRPLMNLGDGHDLMTAYSAMSDKLQFVERDLAQLVSQSHPLALASGDFDEDGVPDLISTYTGTAGVPPASFITLHRGNVDSIYPNTHEAEARKARGEFTDAPFLSPARVFEVATKPDFIGAGDFDADGHLEVVMAARGGNRVYWMAGDGHGGFGSTHVIELPGGVTAMTVGEINRRDGLADVVLGIADTGSAGVSPAMNEEAGGTPALPVQLLVFEGPEGALKHEPEAIALPAPATSFALGQLDDSYEMDLAVAAGNDLVIVHGRDRKLSIDAEEQAKVRAPEVETHELSFTVGSIAIGNFTRGGAEQVAALCEDGSLHILERDARIAASFSGGLLTANDSSAVRRAGSSPPLNGRNDAQGPSPKLVRARVSVSGMDDLVVVDRASRQLHIVSHGVQSTDFSRAVTTRGADTQDPTKVGTLNAVTLDVEGDPIAVLPMRLNSDALSDLVILKNGGISPLAVVPTAPLVTFTVNDNGDGGDGSGTGADEKCETAPGNGVCTLRAAVEKVSKRPGGDLINFSSAFTIKPRFAISITKPVVIDGTSVGRVELDGSNLDGIRDILAIGAKNTVIRALVINRATSAGIYVVNSDVTIENCYIGTDKAGTTSVGLGSIGIDVEFGTNVKIGGTATAARNVIGNPVGEQIRTLSGTSAIIQGNYLGVAATGSAKLATVSDTSIFTRNQLSNTIGGTDPGARNLIAGTVRVIEGGIGNIIQGNYFGLTAGGAALGSRIAAISIDNGSDTTIGGTTLAARNVVNGFVAATGNGHADRTKIQGNYVGVDPSGNNALVQGGSGGGVFISGADCVIGGAVAGAGNVISANGDVGVRVSSATNAKVQGNLIGTNAAGNMALGNGGDGVSVQSSTGVTIGGDGPNIIAFSNRYGVEHIISSGTGVSISRNSIFGNKSLGINSGSKAPVLSMTGSSIQGTLTGTTPNKSFTIEFFSNPDCGSPGSEQGKTFIGPITTSTDGSGNSPVFTGPAGQNVTATATAVGGNTSRFSNCIGGAATPTPTPTPSPQIGLDQTPLNFNAFVGGSNPPVQNVTLKNTGGGALNWNATATSTGNWLSVTGGSQAVTPNNPTTLTVSVNSTNLLSDIYTGMITVSSANASNSPQTVNVTLVVGCPANSGKPSGNKSPNAASCTDVLTLSKEVPSDESGVSEAELKANGLKATISYLLASKPGADLVLRVFDQDGFAVGSSIWEAKKRDPMPNTIPSEDFSIPTEEQDKFCRVLVGDDERLCGKSISLRKDSSGNLISKTLKMQAVFVDSTPRAFKGSAPVTYVVVPNNTINMVHPVLNGADPESFQPGADGRVDFQCDVEYRLEDPFGGQIILLGSVYDAHDNAVPLAFMKPNRVVGRTLQKKTENKPPLTVSFTIPREILAHQIPRIRIDAVLLDSSGKPLATDEFKFETTDWLVIEGISVNGGVSFTRSPGASGFPADGQITLKIDYRYRLSSTLGVGAAANSAWADIFEGAMTNQRTLVGNLMFIGDDSDGHLPATCATCTASGSKTLSPFKVSERASFGGLRVDVRFVTGIKSPNDRTMSQHFDIGLGPVPREYNLQRTRTAAVSNPDATMPFHSADALLEKPRSGEVFIEPQTELRFGSSFRSGTDCAFAHKWAPRVDGPELFYKHRIPTEFARQTPDPGLFDTVKSYLLSFFSSPNEGSSSSANPIAPTACVAPPPNMVGWWPGDGNANDIQGGNNGTLQGGATATAAGKVAQGFSFNGSTGYVSLGNPASLKIAGALSIDAWINPSALPASGNLAAIVTKWAQDSSTSATSDSYALWLANSGGTGTLYSSLHKSTGAAATVQGGTIPLNTWSHIAMTFDPTSGQYALYVNGRSSRIHHQHRE